MQRRYIDVTNLLSVEYITGIQRVVRNVVLVFLKQNKEAYVLLNYAFGETFSIVDKDIFIEFYDNGGPKTGSISTPSAFVSP